MPKETVKDLMKFLKPFPKQIRENALWLRDFVWDLYPNCNELIYDNYNALAFGWSTSDRLGDTFCSIAALANGKYLHFGFYWGSQISDPEKKLSGEGNQYRYIKVHDLKDFPKTYIKKLMKEAYANSMAKLKGGKQILKGATIVKSISAKKRRPKP
ncbi:MAG: hypothetical protein EPN92_03680 [Chitinophagaceae bacterium]|nr:MAG: hypothetical protein EPN92_03680 [Chitinophagaceae bacterium]